MLKSKYFWLALAGGIPFIVVWVKYGIGWAIGMLVALGIILLMLFAQGRRRRRYYYEDEDDSGEIHVYHHRDLNRGSRGRSRFNGSLHIPKINQKGVDFIAGPRRRK